MRLLRCAFLLVTLSNAVVSVPVRASEPDADAAGLRSESASIRRHAAKTLGRVGCGSFVPALIETLRDDDRSVRREVIKALGLLKDRRAVPGLIEALNDDDMNVRFYAAHALGEIKDRRAAGPMVQAFEDKEWCVRDQIAWALREINDPTIVGPVVALLKKADADFEHLSWVLQHLKSDQKVEHLATLLADPSRLTRIRAIEVLARLKSQSAVQPLIQVLNDEDALVRLHVVAVLLELRDNRAVEPLRQLLAREKVATVREAAERAVMELSRHEALVAHWDFDDARTTVARNAIPDGNDGRILGCRSTVGVSGQALEFRGKEYIEFGQPQGLPMAAVPFSVSAWIKSTAADGVVIARGGGFCGFSLYLKSGSARFGIHRLKDEPAYIAQGRQDVAGRWVFLVGVVREDCVQVFVDGQLEATEKTNGYIPGNCGQGMEIGFDVDNSPAEITDHFQGVIDEVKIYAVALSPEEIVEQFRTEGRP